MAGHTKGPWKVFTVKDCQNKGQLLGIGEENGTGVADAYGGLWGSGEEKMANARLIAAAPELLEALRGLLGNAELARFHLQGTEEGMLVGSALFDTIQQALAAIAKATQP